MTFPSVQLAFKDCWKSVTCNCCSTQQTIVIFDPQTGKIIEKPPFVARLLGIAPRANHFLTRVQFDYFLRFYTHTSARDAMEASADPTENGKTWDRRVLRAEPLTKEEMERLLEATELPHCRHITAEQCELTPMPPVLAVPLTHVSQKMHALVSRTLETARLLGDNHGT